MTMDADELFEQAKLEKSFDMFAVMLSNYYKALLDADIPDLLARELVVSYQECLLNNRIKSNQKGET